MCRVPQTSEEAVHAPKSELWSNASDDEMKSLKETHSHCPHCQKVNMQCVRGGYNIKENPHRTEIHKTRFVAKGYSQVAGIDYKEPLPPSSMA